MAPVVTLVLSGGGVTGGDGEDVDIIILMTLTNNQGEPIGAVTNVEPGVLTVTVTDLGGTPIANQIVEVTTTVGEINSSTGSILTNVDGVASTSIVSTG